MLANAGAAALPALTLRFAMQAEAGAAALPTLHLLFVVLANVGAAALPARRFPFTMLALLVNLLLLHHRSRRWRRIIGATSYHGAQIALLLEPLF